MPVKFGVPQAAARPEPEIAVRITPQAEAMLRRLLHHGIYGRSMADIAERLICRELERIFGRESIAP